MWIGKSAEWTITHTVKIHLSTHLFEMPLKLKYISECEPSNFLKLL